MRLIVMFFVCSLLTTLAFSSPVGVDTPKSTKAGTVFIQSAGFDLKESGALTEFIAGESDSRLALLEIGKASDAGTAIVAAWSQWPGHKAPSIRLTQTGRSRDGWEERVFVTYDTPPSASRFVQAIAMRHGETWSVLLIDFSTPELDKLSAAVGQIVTGLRPKGFVLETFSGRTSQPLTPQRLELLKSFVSDSMAKLSIPGAGLAFIEKGKVIWEGGLGVKSLDSGEPVDAHTVFLIASNTKSMATMLLADLVDAGKLKWTTPVTNVYPSFRLGDEVTTSTTQIRHLVCACTGLPRKDFERWFMTTANTPASDTFKQLASTQPTSKFGETYQYNNLMASAAGYVAGQIYYPGMELGSAFDKAANERIFKPLGMGDTTFDFDRAIAGNHADPHGNDLDGKPGVIMGGHDINRNIVPYRPAGGAWSSAHDMIRYVGLELSGGILPNGKQLISRENLFARRERGVSAGEKTWYGMGLEEVSTWGVSVIHHGGDLLGFHSDMIWVPAADVGAVILTNGEDGADLRTPLMRRLLEVLYDGEPEATAMITSIAALNKSSAEEFRSRLIRPADPAATLALASKYQNSELGILSVNRTADKVSFQFNAWSSEVLPHLNIDNTLSFITILPGRQGLDFLVGGSHGKRTLLVRESQHEYLFTETAP